MNWTSPFVFDVKDTIYLIIQGAKYFALIDASQNFIVYNYEGKVISTPKYQGLRVEFLNARHISLSGDVLAIIDPANPKIVRIFDVISGKVSTVNIEHSTEVVEMELNQVEMSSERLLNRNRIMSRIRREARRYPPFLTMAAEILDWQRIASFRPVAMPHATKYRAQQFLVTKIFHRVAVLPEKQP